MSDVLNYPTGSIMVFTYGAYSDYGITAFLVAIKPCNLPLLAKEFQKTRDEWDREDPDGFGSWLVAQGYAMPVDHSEVHVGEYGRWDAEFQMGE